MRTAIAFAEVGTDIAITDINHQTAQAAGRKVIVIKCDITDEAQVQDMVNAVVAQLDGLDFCHANTGICINAAANEITYTQQKKIIDINLNSAFLTDTIAGKYMLSHGGGSIIITTSMSAYIVNVPQSQGAYNAYRTDVIQLTHSLTVEWAKRDVRIISISPSCIDTT